MSDAPKHDWLNQWQTLSRQYLNAWQEMTRSGAAAPTNPVPPIWPPGFEQAARLFGAGGAHNETVDRLIDSAKNYAAMMQPLLATITQAGAPNWNDALQQSAGAMGGNPAMFGSMAAPWPDFSANPFAQAMRAWETPRAPLDEMKSWLNLPAFGLMREHQEHQQKSAAAWLDYTQQTGRYHALMLKASQRGFELLQDKLREREQPGRQIDSLRALYDLWVDAAEEGYAEIALSHEFREIYGAMVNAQMRVRSQIQQEVERIATDLGMPTRSEINSIGERLQALRREVRERLASESATGELAVLRRKLAALKRATTHSRSAVADSATTSAPKPGKKAQPKAKRGRSARGSRADAAATARKPAKRATKKKARKRSANKAVAASAAGNFASRIEQFATASLGSPRGKAKRRKSAASKKKSRQ